MLIRFESHSEAETLLKPAVAGFETVEGLQGEHTTSNMETLLEVFRIQGKGDNAELKFLRQGWFKRGVSFSEVVRLKSTKTPKSKHLRTMGTIMIEARRRHVSLGISRLML